MKKLLVIATLIALVGLMFVMPTNVTHTSAGGYTQSLCPVVYDGIIITAMGESGLYGLKLEDGSQIWKIETPDHTFSSPELDEENGKIYAVLATEMFPYRHLHKIDAKTGKIEWKMPITKGVFGQPLCQDGYVIVPTTGINAGKGTIEVYNTDGEFLWNYWFGGWVISKPLIIGENVIVGSFYGQIEIINLEKGKKSSTWRKPFQTEGSGPYPWNEKDSPANRNGSAIECDLRLHEGRIYFGSYDSHLYNISAAEGTRSIGFEEYNSDWSHKVRWSRSTPLVVDGSIYVGCQSNKTKMNGLYKFEDGTFKKTGHYMIASKDTFVNSSPVYVGGNIIFGTDAGNIICVDKDLTEIWKTNVTPNYVSNRPAVVGDKLIFTARKTNDELKVICVNADNGKVKWEKTK